MKTYQILLSVAVCAGAAISYRTDEPAARERAQGATSLDPRADTAARLFAPGIVSTGDNEFGATVRADRKRVYWTVSPPNPFAYPFVILQSDHSKHGWSVPRVAPFSGTGFSDGDPAIAPDGKRIFFMSRRPADGTGEGRADFDIWLYEFTTRAARRVDNVNSDSMDIAPSVARSGNLYFASGRPGGKGGMDLYQARYNGTGYDAPENLAEVNTASGETNVAVAADESFIIFSTDRPGGAGGADLYIARRAADGRFSDARSVGARVNTTYDDYAPAISADGRTLYFSSRRQLAPGQKVPIPDYAAMRTRYRSAGNGAADVYSIPVAAIR